ncbi:MAG: 2-oxo acid dehydrogenase subunit E2 [Gammaproteobacteria bacterium]|nr:2-oxo acid dehydrogenase subunit E2 [Gammaproteobacteria bacterium]
MTIFNLPDLGEGLLDAEIHEWFVKEGDSVKRDQPLVAMETAKAVVDVPAPEDGIIKKCYGNIGSIIKTGAPLIEFEASEAQTPKSSTVVGKLEETHDANLHHLESIHIKHHLPKATPKVKQLALSLGIDLHEVTPSGEYGVITIDDLYQYQQLHPSLATTLELQIEPLKGVRRQMAKAMIDSHQKVVPVTIFDEATIETASPRFDISVQLIKAICHAAHEEPSLNAWFNGQERQLFKHVNLGLAIDSPDGLFVPVIMNADMLGVDELRAEINRLKDGVMHRSLAPEAFTLASISLSNFGKFAGKFANPVIVPPMVAILAVGRIFEAYTPSTNGPVLSTKIPLSLSFDHRAITGGEATRFLGAIIDFLEKA